MIREENIPTEVKEIVTKLLKLELTAGSETAGIPKLYSQLIEQYIENQEIKKWSHDNNVWTDWKE